MVEQKRRRKKMRKEKTNGRNIVKSIEMPTSMKGEKVSLGVPSGKIYDQKYQNAQIGKMTNTLLLVLSKQLLPIQLIQHNNSIYIFIVCSQERCMFRLN
jgi:transaldolase